MHIEMNADQVDLIHFLLDLANECWDMKQETNGDYAAEDVAFVDSQLNEGKVLVQRLKESVSQRLAG